MAPRVHGISEVPELHRPIKAGRGDGPAVGTERHGGHRAVVPAEVIVDQTAIAGVPDPHDVGREGRDDGPAVRAPGQPEHGLAISLESERGEAGVDGVEHEALARTGPRQALAVGAERYGMDAAGQVCRPSSRRDPCRPPEFPRVPVPELDEAVLLEAGEGLPVGTECHVSEDVLASPEREPILVRELPEVTPLPSAGVGLATAWPQEVDQAAKAANVVVVPGGEGEVGAGRVNGMAQLVLGGEKAWDYSRRRSGRPAAARAPAGVGCLHPHFLLRRDAQAARRRTARMTMNFRGSRERRSGGAKPGGRSSG